MDSSDTTNQVISSDKKLDGTAALTSMDKLQRHTPNKNFDLSAEVNDNIAKETGMGRLKEMYTFTYVCLIVNTFKSK